MGINSAPKEGKKTTGKSGGGGLWERGPQARQGKMEQGRQKGSRTDRFKRQKFQAKFQIQKKSV